MTREEALKEAELLLKRATALSMPASGELVQGYAKAAEVYVQLAKELRLGS